MGVVSSQRASRRALELDQRCTVFDKTVELDARAGSIKS